jgi:hypothetical protein
MRKKFDTEEVRRLATIIDVIARKCWRGIPALMGESPKPTREQLREALFYHPSPDADLGTKVSRSGNVESREIALEDKMIDEVDVLLESFDWEELVRAVKGYAADFPRNWAMYRRLLLTQEQTRSSWGGDAALSRTAERFSTTYYILRMTAREVPYKIAWAVSQGYYSVESFLTVGDT